MPVGHDTPSFPRGDNDDELDRSQAFCIGARARRFFADRMRGPRVHPHGAGGEAERPLHFRRRSERLDHAAGRSSPGENTEPGASGTRGGDLHAQLHRLAGVQPLADGPLDRAPHVQHGHVLELPVLAGGASGRRNTAKLLHEARLLDGWRGQDLPQRPAPSAVMERLLSLQRRPHAGLLSSHAGRDGEHAPLRQHVR